MPLGNAPENKPPLNAPKKCPSQKAPRKKPLTKMPRYKAPPNMQLDYPLYSHDGQKKVSPLVGLTKAVRRIARVLLSAFSLALLPASQTWASAYAWGRGLTNPGLRWD